MSRQRSSHSSTWPQLEPRSAEASLLTPGQVSRLRDARTDGVPIKVLAQRFGVSKELVTALTTEQRERSPRPYQRSAAKNGAPATPCPAPGCDRSIRAGGYCEAHYRQVRVHGRTFRIARSQRSTLPEAA